jgi:hypothetical protein
VLGEFLAIHGSERDANLVLSELVETSTSSFTLTTRFVALSIPLILAHSVTSCTENTTCFSIFIQNLGWNSNFLIKEKH